MEFKDLPLSIQEVAAHALCSTLLKMESLESESAKTLGQGVKAGFEALYSGRKPSNLLIVSNEKHYSTPNELCNISMRAHSEITSAMEEYGVVYSPSEIIRVVGILKELA